jgi:hypothetical protein
VTNRGTAGHPATRPSVAVILALIALCACSSSSNCPVFQGGQCATSPPPPTTCGDGPYAGTYVLSLECGSYLGQAASCAMCPSAASVSVTVGDLSDAMSPPSGTASVTGGPVVPSAATGEHGTIDPPAGTCSVVLAKCCDQSSSAEPCIVGSQIAEVLCTSTAGPDGGGSADEGIFWLMINAKGQILSPTTPSGPGSSVTYGYLGESLCVWEPTGMRSG